MSIVVTIRCNQQETRLTTEGTPLYASSVAVSSKYWGMSPLDGSCAGVNGGMEGDECLRDWARRRGGRLLVVDDSPVERAVTGSLLERSGFCVVLASGGREAVEIMGREAHPFDAVVMDVSMPDMDGLTATRKIRLLSGARGHVPIIALTANAGDQDRADCLAAGMNAHTCKPLSLPSLLGAMRAHLPADVCCR